MFAGTVWGASFLFIAEGLQTFTPSQIAFGRLGCAFLTLSLMPKARRAKIEPADWRGIALLGVFWMAFPFWLFPVAEQRVSSSLAGMLNGAVPLFTAAIAAIMLSRLPPVRQAIGLLVGAIGIVMIGLPAFGEGGNSAAGVGLIVIALLSYGLSINISVPLTQKYGPLAVLWRAQAIALVLSTPGATWGLRSSSFAVVPALAVLALGVGGTALAYLAVMTLAGRAGSTRASATIYIAPPVALALGVLIRGESVAVISVIGSVVVLVGALLTSRAS